MSVASKAFWLDLLQHTVRAAAVAMLASITVSSAGTAGGYLPVTEVDWLGGLYIGATAAVFTVLLGLTSIVIPGADPDTISWLPPKSTPDPAPAAATPTLPPPAPTNSTP